MLAELCLSITSREARLTYKSGEKVTEDEVWTFPRPLSRTEAKELAEAVFHEAFDLIQYAVHGDGDS
jgi:hypothetical protein